MERNQLSGLVEGRPFDASELASHRLRVDLQESLRLLFRAQTVVSVAGPTRDERIAQGWPAQYGEQGRHIDH